VKLSAALRWILSRTRPEFHYATWVVFVGAVFFVCGIVPLALVFAVLRPERGPQYELLGLLVGPGALGGLIAGYLRHHLPNRPYRPWVVAAVFGGVAGAVCAGIVEFKLGRSISQGMAAGLAIGASSAALLLWLALRELSSCGERAA